MRPIPPDLAPRLGMYGVADMLNRDEWKPLGERLLALYAQLSRVPGVPASWMPQVQAEIQAGALVRPFQPAFGGNLRTDIPAWLTASPSLQSTWADVAKAAEKAVNLYANQRRIEGLEEVAALTRRAAFWDAAYRSAVAIRDAPKNAVAATLSGVQDVAGGLAWTVLKSPIVWVSLAVVAVALIGPGKVARAAMKAKG